VIGGKKYTGYVMEKVQHNSKRDMHRLCDGGKEAREIDYRSRNGGGVWFVIGKG